MLIVTKYLGLRHCYGELDCITLIKIFYETELNISFDLPSYKHSNRWMLNFTAQQLDHYISQYATKTSLTAAKNYDLMVFKSKSGIINHFGMFLAPASMLHVEEGAVSKIEMLSDYWLDSLYGIYRHEQLVR